MHEQEYTNPYGVWSVTTEGDCEGKTTRELGTYEGYIDEIAFDLAGHCYYSLHFKKAKNLQSIKKPGTSVSIQLCIDSNTWDLSGSERIEFFERLFKDRDVTVKHSNYFAAIMIYAGKTEEQMRQKENTLKIQQALQKLTEEERKLLGLK